MLAKAKKGWFQRDWMNDTADVWGSVNQCHAPTAVHTEITARRTETLQYNISKIWKDMIRLTSETYLRKTSEKNTVKTIKKL